ncbi:hypothetical protein NQZ68_003484 [Dissostichus eleginoides]|nr:hypothetical protein NQZ68_003484 [Dissostichus eleginoides]
MVPKVNHLANWEMCLPDSLVMPLFPAASSSQQPFTSTLESNSESGLVFDHPVLYPARYRLLHSTQEKVYRKLRFLSKHHRTVIHQCLDEALCYNRTAPEANRKPNHVCEMLRTKLLDQRILEAPSLVRMKTAWDAKFIKPFVDQNVGHRGGPLVPSGNSYCEFAEHVSHDKDVLKPVPGGFQQGEIYCQDFIGS